MIGALTAWLQLVRDLWDKFRPPGSDQSDGGLLATPTPSIFNVIGRPLVVHQVADHSEPGAKAVPEDRRSEQRGVTEPAVHAVPVIAAARSWARSGRMAARRSTRSAKPCAVAHSQVRTARSVIDFRQQRSCT